jgi:hypothetical protein
MIMHELPPSGDNEPAFTQHFINAVLSVHDYNTRHKKIDGELFNIIQMTQLSAGLITPEQVQHQDESVEMNRELLKMIQGDRLADMGVRIFDPSASEFKEFVMEDPENPSYFPKELMLIAEDMPRWLDTVRNLEPTTDTAEITRLAVNTVLSTSVTIVQEVYGSEFEDSAEVKADVQALADEHLEMFRDVHTILAEKGLDDTYAINQLSKYLARQMSGTLTDYIKAELQGYWNGPDQYGPSKWQSDATPMMLEARWFRAIRFLLELRDREAPSPMYTEIFQKLRNDFDTAMQWVAEHSISHHDYWKLRKPMESINKAWSVGFPLENSFHHTERAEKGLQPITFDPNDPEPQEIIEPVVPEEDRWWT